ncbi:hypothetical protein MMC22_009371 [Lobaria immixta]|nr:hypothetical protein [Lobaria immixta]
MANLGYGSRMSWEETPDLKSRAKAALDNVQELRQLTLVLCKSLQQVQNDQAKFKDKQTKPRAYKIGEKVYLNGKNIRTKQNNKLEWKIPDKLDGQALFPHKKTSTKWKTVESARQSAPPPKQQQNQTPKLLKKRPTTPPKMEPTPAPAVKGPEQRSQCQQKPNLKYQD